jgi:hypothetical protein
MGEDGTGLKHAPSVGQGRQEATATPICEGCSAKPFLGYRRGAWAFIFHLGNGSLWDAFINIPCGVRPVTSKAFSKPSAVQPRVTSATQ